MPFLRVALSKCNWKIVLSIRRSVETKAVRVLDIQAKLISATDIWYSPGLQPSGRRSRFAQATCATICSFALAHAAGVNSLIRVILAAGNCPVTCKLLCWRMCKSCCSALTFVPLNNSTSGSGDLLGDGYLRNHSKIFDHSTDFCLCEATRPSLVRWVPVSIRFQLFLLPQPNQTLT
jgi:hypothetical protein